MTLSNKGIALLKEFEGLRLHEYIDAGGFLSIGFGHLLQNGERYENGITLEKAMELLEQDVQDAEFVVEGMVTVPLNQNQFDALVSFAYNVGGDQFAKSTLVRLLNDGMYDEVPHQLSRWNKSNGKVLRALVRRRKAEGDLFMEPMK